jgi:tetratricopeptide (TPR) repeat protein
MSHIDNALKKAQEEKDNVYQRYIRITPVATRKNNTGRKVRRVIVAAIALISLSAIILLVFKNNAQDNNESVIPHKNIVAKKASTSRQKTAPSPGSIKKDANTISGARKPGGHVVAADKDMVVPNASEKAGQRESNVDNLYKKALDWYQKGNPDKAGEEYKKVLSIEPNHAFALNNLGVICMSRKENKEAGNMFRKAIELKADYVDPYYNMACLYSLSGNISKSLYYLKMAVSINNSVKNWAKNDKDLEGLRMSEIYKKIME